MAVTMLSLAVIGWGAFFLIVQPGHYAVGNKSIFGFGLAITAFTLGIRHAFDADHIAAIDNTTRKLVTDGQRPVSVGFWFAVGHSTVVIVAVGLLAAGLHVLAHQMEVKNSAFITVMDTWGALVAGLFLLVIGVVNLVSLFGIWQVFRRMRSGRFSEPELERLLQQRGMINKILGPLARSVDRPWKMFPIGVLFGLGFDTATTIGLFVIGGGAALTAPWYVVMVLPVLFTLGMMIFDSLDGLLMNGAYRWAYARPVRRVYYNLTVTVLSVAVAFLVGIVTLTGLLNDWVQTRSGPLAWIAGLDLENFGFIIVGLFIVTWLAAVAYWKLARVEARFS